MQPPDSIVTLAAVTRQFLTTRAVDELAGWLNAWPASPSPRPVQPALLPVLRWLPDVVRSAPAECAAVAAALEHASAALAWRQTYSASEVGEEFLRNYGWAELVGNRGALAGDGLACGFLLLGPRTRYPSHSHQAEEIYVPLSGEAAWQRGRETWQPRSPGAVIHHRSDQPHAMHTGEEPLLALYLWRGAGLRESARLTAHGDSP